MNLFTNSVISSHVKSSGPSSKEGSAEQHAGRDSSLQNVILKTTIATHDEGRSSFLLAAAAASNNRDNTALEKLLEERSMEDGEGGEQGSPSKLSMANNYGAQELSFEGAREVEALVR